MVAEEAVLLQHQWILPLLLRPVLKQEMACRTSFPSLLFQAVKAQGRRKRPRAAVLD